MGRAALTAGGLVGANAPPMRVGFDDVRDGISLVVFGMLYFALTVTDSLPCRRSG